MDPIKLLKDDHKKVKAMFREFESAGDRAYKTKQEIAEKVFHELEIHTQLEEELLYPAAREVLTRDEDIVDEAYVEHAGAKNLISQLKTMTSDQPLFDAKVKVLGEYIDHHVKEEESQFFPKLRQTPLDLEAMGEQPRKA